VVIGPGPRDWRHERLPWRIGPRCRKGLDPLRVPREDDPARGRQVSPVVGVVITDAGGKPSEFGGPSGPVPTRYGDWERKGRCIDF